LEGHPQRGSRHNELLRRAAVDVDALTG
jgi:hypothetical protein